MINLIKNEFIKIVKKKSFIIMLLIVSGYSFLTNFVYKTLFDITADFDFEQTISIDDKEDLEYKVGFETEKELKSLTSKYDKSSWQYNYAEENAYDYIYEIKSYEIGLTDDKEIYEQEKENYEALKNDLDNKDWKDIVKEEKLEYEKALEVADDREKETIKVHIEALDLRLEKNISFARTEMNQILLNYETNKINLLEYSNVDNLSESQKEIYYGLREEMLIDKYSLDHGVNAGESGNSRTIFINFFSEYSFIILIMVFVVAGPIMSNEYNNGTIKLLLTRPYTRTKILLSKYITVLISIIFSILIVSLIQLVVGGIVLDFDSLKIPAVVYSSVTDSLTTYNLITYAGLSILSLLPSIIIVSTVVFALSTLFSSTAIATFGGFAIYSLSDLLYLFNSTNKWWVKYLWSYNWDFTPYIFNKAPSIEGLNIWFSLAVCVAYLLIILIPTFVLFNRKDISNT